MIRFICIAVFLILYLILSIPVFLVEWIIGKFNRRAKDISSLRIVQWGFKVILKMTGVTTTVIGEENVPDEPVLFIGDGVVPAKQAFEEGLTCAYKIAPAHICTQRAGSVALAAKDMAEAGEVISSDAFHPEYLRPSQAERELKRGTVSNS